MKIYIILFRFYLLLTVSFSSAGVDENREDPFQPVFRVGAVDVSRHLYERELSKQRDIHANDFDDLARKRWLDEWADRLRIVSLAREEKFESNAEVQETVERMSRYMLVEGRQGPFRRLIVDPMLDASRVGAEKLSERDRETERRAIFDKLASQYLESAKVTIDSVGAYWILNAFRENSLINQDSLPVGGKGAETVLLYSYTSDGESVAVSVAAFLWSYDKRLIKRPLRSREILRGEIQSIVVGDYFYKQAINLELDLDARFQVELENFRNEVIYNVYLENLAKRRSPPSDEEAKLYYESHKADYSVAESVAFWEIKAESRAAAIAAKRRISAIQPEDFGKELRLDLLNISGVKVARMRLGYGNSRYGDRNDKSLFGAESGWVSPLFRHGERTLFLVKIEDLGRKVLSYPEVEEDVFKSLRKLSVDHVQEGLMPSLRERYPFDLSLR